MTSLTMTNWLSHSIHPYVSVNDLYVIGVIFVQSVFFVFNGKSYWSWGKQSRFLLLLRLHLEVFFIEIQNNSFEMKHLEIIDSYAISKKNVFFLNPKIVKYIEIWDQKQQLYFIIDLNHSNEFTTFNRRIVYIWYEQETVEMLKNVKKKLSKYCDVWIIFVIFCKRYEKINKCSLDFMF